MKKRFLPILLFISMSVWAQNEAPSATNATSGKLTVNFSMNNAGGSYGKEEAIAVFITNSSSVLVNTLYYRTTNGNSSAQDLTTWWSKIGSSFNKSNTTNLKILTDANTGATTTSYLTNQVAYWGNNAAATSAVSATADGTYTVNFEVVNASGASARKYYSGTFVKGPIAANSTVTATVGFSGITISWVPVTTVINDVELEKLYNVYPNPAISSIYVSGTDIKDVEICSLTGRSILISKEQNVNVSSLPKGMYLAVVRSKTGTIVKKIEKR
jgi:hypothetical protein